MSKLFALALPLLLTNYLFSQNFRDVEEILTTHVENGFSGTVLIAQHEKIILSEGYGFTSESSNFRITPETTFNIASITKSITALAVLKLAESGHLDISKPISYYLDDVPADKNEITVHHLLTHTSGLSNGYLNRRVTSSEEASKRILKRKLESVHGAEFRYSNLNYKLLALIAEQATGLKYEEFVRSEILDKAGMNSTFFWDEIEHHDEQTTAQKIEKFKKSRQIRNWEYLGSGGIFSSSKDLFKLHQALVSNKIISSETRSTGLKKHEAIRDGLSMGYGWFITSDKKKIKEIWTRGNESFGHNAVMRWFPDENIVIIVMSNTGEKGSPILTDNRIVSDALVNAIIN